MSVFLKEIIRCKKCGSSQCYIRVKKKERICRSCGNVEKLEKANEEENATE